MKRLIFVVAVLLVSLPSQGQYAPQYQLLEHFTNTRCVLCPARNQAMYQTIASNPGYVHLVSYHPPVPYQNDVFYVANPVPQETRRQHYGVPGTPQAFLRGANSQSGTTLLPTSKVNAAKADTAGIDIQLDETLTQGDIQVLVNVRTVNEGILPTSADYRLFVILIEDSVEYSAPNGEDLHLNIFREALTDMEGDIISAQTMGGSTPVSFTYTLNQDWDANHVHALAFIFHDTDGFINSGRAGDLRVSVSASASTNGSDGTAIVSVSGGLAPYSYQWNDPAQQTTATASNLGAGEYLVNVTDQNGLTFQEKVTIEGVATSNLELINPFDLKSYDNWVWAEDLLGEAKIRVIDLRGQLVYQTGINGSEKFKLPEFGSGIYVIELSQREAVSRIKARLR
ncbi:MAG: Omp28-related outer membrane protein [Bacteroidota bacterium]